jgi:diguanylate cyclase (GGDEF)-like protein
MSASPALHVSASPFERALTPTFRASFMVFAAVSAACLFGIWTRPVDFLASVWPANAVMLGILLRHTPAAAPLGWLAGMAALLATDMLTGAALRTALLLNAANLVSIGVAYAIYTRGLRSMPPDMRQPASMLLVILASAAGGAAAGVVGCVANPIIFGGDILKGWTFWFATEFVNYVAILPVILSMPTRVSEFSGVFEGLSTKRALPVFALAFSFAAAAAIGGPGAIAFPVPALLWCGLVYAVFPTTILTLLFGLWTLVVIGAGYLPSGGGAYDEMTIASVRLGASLVAVVPIVLSSVMQGRNEMIAKLHNLASYDALTGVLNRRAFSASAGAALERRTHGSALIMIDLDHFKSVNDTYGHAGGDDVLVAFARRAGNCLRKDVLLGRMGGEEFAVMIVNCTPDDACNIAERVRCVVASDPVLLRDGRTVPITASLGLAMVAEGEARSLDDVLAAADSALYRAKRNGRNRIETSSAP